MKFFLVISYLLAASSFFYFEHAFLIYIAIDICLFAPIWEFYGRNQNIFLKFCNRNNIQQQSFQICEKQILTGFWIIWLLGKMIILRCWKICSPINIRSGTGKKFEATPKRHNFWLFLDISCARRTGLYRYEGPSCFFHRLSSAIFSQLLS